MPRRNRVDPFGDLHAVPQRMMFTGNRGSLVDDSRTAHPPSQRLVVDHLPDRVPRLEPSIGPAAPVDPAVLSRRRSRLGGRASPVRDVPQRCLPVVPRCVDARARPRPTGSRLRDQFAAERRTSAPRSRPQSRSGPHVSGRQCWMICRTARLSLARSARRDLVRGEHTWAFSFDGWVRASSPRQTESPSR